MNPIFDLFISIIIASIVLVVVLVQTKRSEAGMEGSINNLKKSLHQTESILHEFQKFKAAFDNSYDAMVIANADGRILYINNSVTRITGFGVSEVIGTKAGKLWGGLMSESYYRKMWIQVKTKKKPLVGRIVNKRKNREKYLADVTITPILDDQAKKVIHFIAIERDLGVPPVGAIDALNSGQQIHAKYLARNAEKKSHQQAITRIKKRAGVKPAQSI